MLTLRRTAPVLGAIAACAIACASCTTPTRGGEDGGDDTGDGGGSGSVDEGMVNNGPLVVSPAKVTVNVNGKAATQAFTATLNGTDVTSQVMWNLADPTYGGVSSAGLFTSAYPLPHGGVVTLAVSYRGENTAATITINDQAPDVLDPSAPAGAAGDFGGAADTVAANKPGLVYPFDGTMLARNINQVNLQWSDTAKHTAFRLHLVGATIDQSFYVGASACKNGHCSYQPKDADWQAVALSAAGDKVALTISGSTGKSTAVASSTVATINFSPDDVKGGLYYFSTSASGILRLPFGASKATEFLTPKTNSTGACYGCHAVSRDGKKVVSVFDSPDGYVGMVDGSDGSKILVAPDTTQKNFASNFETFSPDGTQMISNWAGVLTLRDGTTGKKIMDIPSSYYGGKAAVMPEWSADGMNITFVAIDANGFLATGMEKPGDGYIAGDWAIGNAGSIMLMPVNGGSFGAAKVIAAQLPKSEYNFYPTFSPDSQWVVFATGTYPGSSYSAENGLAQLDTTNKCVSYDQDTARLRMVSVNGGAIIELKAATHAMNKTATWPKFAPFIQGSGNLMFISFSSKFDYGYVVTGGTSPQLWMSAIDVSKAMDEFGMTDPSYPPFWLPFQDPTQNNHEAIWTTDVACSNASGTGCPGEFTCVNGSCMPNMIM